MKQVTQQELLDRIARQELLANQVGTVNDSVICQVVQGWPREVLLKDVELAVVHNALELEEAVQNPDVHSIFVPRNAALTQEVTERILTRNPLPNTIFWEVA